MTRQDRIRALLTAQGFAGKELNRRVNEIELLCQRERYVKTADLQAAVDHEVQHRARRAFARAVAEEAVTAELARREWSPPEPHRLTLVDTVATRLQVGHQSPLDVAVRAIEQDLARSRRFMEQRARRQAAAARRRKPVDVIDQDVLRLPR